MKNPKGGIVQPTKQHVRRASASAVKVGGVWTVSGEAYPSAVK